MAKINWEVLIKILKAAIDQEVSDVYIRQDQSIVFKDAKWTIIFDKKTNFEEFKEILKFLMDKEDKMDEAIKTVEEWNRFLFWATVKWVLFENEIDIWLRLRWQLVKDSGWLFLTLRIFLNKYVDYEELTKYSKIWDKLDDIFKIKQWLIIIIGWTGQGKSTLVSAYLEKLIKEDSYKFLKTIEDPIEHIFKEDITVKSSRWTMVSQMEIWKHVISYEEAILSCSRDNSDIVYIQEIASRESAVALKKVMNSGKLVIITLHAAKVTQAIARLLVLMREFDWDDSFNKRMLAQESICIIWQNLITGYVLDKNWNRLKWKWDSYLQKKYWIQELLNIGPTERNFIMDDWKVHPDFEKDLTKSLNDNSKWNISLNKILLEFYVKWIIDAQTLISRTNDIFNLKNSIENEWYENLKNKEDFKYLENFILDKKRW